MLDFLPKKVKSALSYINGKKLYEIRLRANLPATVNYEGVYRYLGEYGLTDCPKNALRCDFEEISDCVYKAGKYSVYAVEEQIRQGFITADHGERIGLAGEFVFERGQPLTLRNFTSLCIRVPHEIEGCASEIYNLCMRDKVRSVLIASPPGLGKTTILRDLSRKLSENTRYNILLCDERGEISAGNTGESCDILKYADKKTAFTAGIRAMRPDIVITDELSKEDCIAVEKAILAGIKVVASAHFHSIDGIKEPYFGLFERYIILRENEIGGIKGIYDANGKEIEGD